MGHELYYQPDNRHMGSVSLRRWEEISKLLPLLLDFVNRAMENDWQSGVARDVRVFADGVIEPPLPQAGQPHPALGPFLLERMLSEALWTSEIRFFEAAEWNRLFAWCDFLAERMGRADFIGRWSRCFGLTWRSSTSNKPERVRVCANDETQRGAAYVMNKMAPDVMIVGPTAAELVERVYDIVGS